jgi:hypothetical protein
MSCTKSWRESVISLAFGALALPLTGNGCTSLCNAVDTEKSSMTFQYVVHQKLA